ncbi:MAG: PD-(D/E)XK nuclease family protein [Candidatus Omnitrophica bacterium]|nr:PD-(D/E)XK nuclease family protein [Candidatus Omnitrophota bacterium]
MIKLSPSSLNLFLDCPRCFWLYVNKGVKRPGPPVATITSGLDRVVKEYFNLFRSTQGLPPFLEGKVPGKLMARLPYRGWFEFTDESNDAKLGGYLDECIEVEKGFYAALDHKTRGSVPDTVHEAYQLQMDVYTFLLEKNQLPTHRKAYLVYYIPQKMLPKGEFQFETSVKEITTDPGRAQEVFRRAVALLHGPVPAAGDECEFCKWALTTVGDEHTGSIPR